MAFSCFYAFLRGAVRMSKSDMRDLLDLQLSACLKLD